MESLIIDAFCSATRRLPVSTPQSTCFDPRKQPEQGDIVVGKVTAVGQHDRMEITGGREVPLRPGLICAVVLSRRYSTMEFHGEVPEKLSPGASFHLLNVGGAAGQVVDRNTATTVPTSLEFKGYACTPSGERLSLRDHHLETRTGGPLPKVILVLGADMDVGKTTAAASAVRMLVDVGHRTGGVKLTGTTRMKDLLVMRDAGADPTFDFADFGLPSTFGASDECLIEMFRGMRRACGVEGCEYVAVEVADGLLQAETRRILASAEIMGSVSVIVFASADSLGAYGGCVALKRLGHTPDFLGGLFTAGKLKIQEVRSWSRIPILSTGLEPQRQFVDFVRSAPAAGTKAPG